MFANTDSVCVCACVCAREASEQGVFFFGVKQGMRGGGEITSDTR